MGYPLEKLFLRCFFHKGLIRHPIIWETLHFQGFNVDMVFYSQRTSFTQRKVDQILFLFFFQAKKKHNRVPSNKCIIEDVGHSWGTPLKNVLLFYFKGFNNKASIVLGNFAFSRL